MTKLVDSENDKYMLVCQFAADASLRDYLTRNQISRKAKLKMARDIAKGLKYLHERGIVHENLVSCLDFLNQIYNKMSSPIFMQYLYNSKIIEP
ncbi:28305_t:CDS:2 [Gigaspora margarita]|uniref:28305_t:CDS:1 n=1 Tax=Gigaspora margarita TaxID=4874 RepID=A0ABN7UDS9_GIGMA|nr:28305_t:CDS:2 [Gigaspora margarita]